MPSSIFSFRSPPLFHTKLFLGFCAALAGFLEVSSNYLLRHHSETYARVHPQYEQAVRIAAAQPGAPLAVLMVGNSLLLEGIDTPRLQSLTSSQMHLYPLLLEATGYEDWFYALRHLFQQGARPQVVILGVGVGSFLGNTVRQDYAPLMLFDFHDTLSVASELKMDRTATSNLLLSHESAFWDTRSVLRMQILRHALPHCRELFQLLKSQPPIPTDPQFDAIADSRLERLRALCGAYGARLILLIPPTPSSAHAVRHMALASQKAGVDVLVPLDPSTVPERYYQSDELHLNSEGAGLFTAALAMTLRPTLENRTPVWPR